MKRSEGKGRKEKERKRITTECFKKENKEQ